MNDHLSRATFCFARKRVLQDNVSYEKRVPIYQDSSMLLNIFRFSVNGYFRNVTGTATVPSTKIEINPQLRDYFTRSL